MLPAEETSDSSSLEENEESIAEALFSGSSKNSFGMEPDTFRQVAEQQSCRRALAQTNTQLGLSQRSKTNQTAEESKSTHMSRMSKEESIKHSNFPELKAAYLAISEKKETLKKYIDVMKPNKIEHPKSIEDAEERAHAYWRWAFEKVKSREIERKRLE